MSSKERKRPSKVPLLPAVIEPTTASRMLDAFVGARRRLPSSSLAWRLSFIYAGVLAVLLLALAAFLLSHVNTLLIEGADRSFQHESQAAAAVHHDAYSLAPLKRDNPNACDISYIDSFQTALSDPLTQAPSNFESVLLIDRTTGRVLAPVGAQDTIPPELQPDKLAQLDQKLAAPANIATTTWLAGISSTTVNYHMWLHGNDIAVSLIAYDYRVITSCDLRMSKRIPAVVLITQNFAPVHSTIDRFNTDLIVGVVVLFLIGLLLGVWMISHNLRPLERVAAAARDLAGGDLKARVHLHGPPDEIVAVAQAFDEMAERVEFAFQQQIESEWRIRQFIADAAHELRTPMTAVKVYMDVISQREVGDPEPMGAKQMIRAAQRESERMKRLVDDMLTLARLDASRPLVLSWVDLWDLAGQAVDQARLLAGEREVNISSDGQGQLRAYIDRDRVTQVLLILLDNALKYGRQDASGWVRVHLERTPTSALITVTDNGPGINPSDLPHVFERFFRARAHDDASPAQFDPNDSPAEPSSPNGSGLGLAIAQAIVAAHEGSIIPRSILGEGTTFLIVLPLGGPMTDEHIEI